MITATKTSFEIIEVIQCNRGARLSTISSELDVSKSTIHNHLVTLQELGYIVKTGQIYDLSLQFLNVGQYSRYRDKRYQLAEETVTRLAKELEMPVDFNVELNGRILKVFQGAETSTQSGLVVGDQLYLHCSSTGKAILAEYSNERVVDILERTGMPRITQYTITEIDSFLSELSTTRERGYAVSNQEWIEGLRTISVVVRQPDGEPFGVISSGGPTYILTDETIKNGLLDSLSESAAELEDDIAEVMITGQRYDSPDVEPILTRNLSESSPST